jgi:hypothetical protein
MADYRNIINFIKFKEGGLSSATTDSASNNPSPCGNGSNGKPYHTNKGVTWATFKGLSSTLGYSASCANFISMPDSIWGKIYKESYWDKIQGDKIKNQAIANTFVEMAWGSGVGSNTSTKGAIPYLKNFFKKYYNKSFNTITEMVNYVNELDSQGKTPDLFEKLFVFRKNLYTSFNQPSNLKGWLNRLDSFYLINKPYALSTGNKIAVTIGVISIILGTRLYFKYAK